MPLSELSCVTGAGKLLLIFFLLSPSLSSLLESESELSPSLPAATGAGVEVANFFFKAIFKSSSAFLFFDGVLELSSSSSEEEESELDSSLLAAGLTAGVAVFLAAGFSS